MRVGKLVSWASPCEYPENYIPPKLLTNAYEIYIWVGRHPDYIARFWVCCMIVFKDTLILCFQFLSTLHVCYLPACTPTHVACRWQIRPDVSPSGGPRTSPNVPPRPSMADKGVARHWFPNPFRSSTTRCSACTILGFGIGYQSTESKSSLRIMYQCCKYNTAGLFGHPIHLQQGSESPTKGQYRMRERRNPAQYSGDNMKEKNARLRFPLELHSQWGYSKANIGELLLLRLTTVFWH